MQGSLPYRYARALIALAEEADEVDSMAEELIQLQEVSAQADRLDHFLAEPVIPSASRKKTLDEVLKNLSASPLLKRFCSLLLERERFAWFEEIIAAYFDLRDDLQRIVRVQVTSAVPLEPELAEQLESILRDKTGKEVAVDYAEDASLIGGLVIQLGGRVYDGSVRGDLMRIQEKILKGMV